MKNVSLGLVLLGFAIGALIVYLLCCRHECPDHAHKQHIFKTWRGYVEEDTTKSVVEGLTKVRFLDKLYYFDNDGGKKEIPRGISNVFIARKVPVKGSPFPVSKDFAEQNQEVFIDLLYVVDDRTLDSLGEFYRCPTTGKWGCFPVTPQSTLRYVTDSRNGESKYIVTALAYIHTTTTPTHYQWALLEFNKVDFDKYVQSFDPSAEKCVGVMLDHGSRTYTYDSGTTREVYDNWRFEE